MKADKLSPMSVEPVPNPLDSEPINADPTSGLPASGFSDPVFAIDAAGNVFISEINLANVAIEREDFEAGWFGQQGSLGKAFQLFGNKLDDLISELNEKLVA